MVLESLFNSEDIAREPFKLLLVGFLLSGAAMFTSHLIFMEHTSVLSVAFITIGLTPLIHAFYTRLEAQETKIGKTFMERHMGLIKIYSWIFIGIILSYGLWFTVLPEKHTDTCFGSNCFHLPTKSEVFSEQTKTLEGIKNLKNRITGQATLPEIAHECASIIADICLSGFSFILHFILVNNLNVLILAALFSFLYGAGALFLISWNASVLGTLLGQNILAENHFGFLGLLPHGIPELLGYFFAAIGGGILSVAIVKRNRSKNEFKIVAIDAFILFVLAIVSLVVGAIIEAYLITGDELFALTIATIYIIALIVLVVGHGTKHYKN